MNIKEIVLNMIKGNSNPMIGNLLQMAEKNDVKSLESFARNLCKDKGIDFDKEINNFRNMIMNGKR